MKNKGYVTTEMAVSRLVDWGQITDLSQDFRLKGGTPFSVFVRPTGTAGTSIVISAEPYQREGFVPTPVALDGWNELLITAIEANSIDLATYDVWWGAGASSESSNS